MTAPNTTWTQRAGEALVAQLPHHFERLSWSPAIVRRHQTQALRRVVRHAIAGSAFHRARLGHLDVDRLTLEGLADLPPMTKAEMMDAFDDVVTDHRLDRERVEGHLSTAGPEPTLIDGTFVAIASGGTSGRRALYCYHRDRVPEYVATVLRSSLAGVAAAFGWPPPFRPKVTVTAAPSSIHATGAAPALLAAFADVTRVPATLPFEEIVAGVEASEPTLLVGYTSVIARLADARREGRLRIDPASVVVTSEQLTTDLRERIVAGFGAPPANSFGSSEGLMGSAAPGRDDFTFASDTAYVEFVDDHDRAVPTGTAADHVLVTHLTNTVQPLIRFRLDDRMTPLAPDPGHGHQRARVEGRLDTTLLVGGVAVHPVLVRSALLAHPEILEHQIVERPGGIGVRVVASPGADPIAVRTTVETSVRRAGFPGAIECRVVDTLERDARSGKVAAVVRAGSPAVTPS